MRQSTKCRRSMNSLRTKALLAIVGLGSLVFTSRMSAQTDDFGLDFSLGAEKKICKGVDVGIEGYARTQDNTQKIERWGAGASVGVKVVNTKTFSVKASAKWEYMWINNLAERTEKRNGYNYTNHFWRNRHRTSASLSAAYSPSKRWEISWKETFQYNHFCESSKTTEKWRFEDKDDMNSLYLSDEELKTVMAKDRTVLRSKITVQYDTKHCPIDPYISGEYGCGLNYSTNKWKFEAGADYKLNKKNKINLFYRYLTEDDDDEPNGHLVGIGYSIKL